MPCEQREANKARRYVLDLKTKAGDINADHIRDDNRRRGQRRDGRWEVPALPSYARDCWYFPTETTPAPSVI